MSFALTTAQILARNKTVTRRVGWTFLKPGDLLQAIEKGQGLKKGEKVRKLAVLRVDDVRQEPLGRMYDEPSYGIVEVKREGFAGLCVGEFLDMFMRSHAEVRMQTPVTRIQFSYVEAVR